MIYFLENCLCIKNMSESFFSKLCSLENYLKNILCYVGIDMKKPPLKHKIKIKEIEE